MKKPALIQNWLLGGILISASGLKTALCLASVLPFNADEAVVALMARHILAGERPIFFYGQAYMGSLDAFLIAAGFLIAGQQVWVIRLIQGLLYLGAVYTTFLMGVNLLGSPRVGLIAAAMMALPTVNVTLYTTITLGGYGEALLLGNIIVLIGIKIIKSLQKADAPLTARNWLAMLMFGLLSGLGLWANGLTMVYVMPAGLALAYYLLRNWRLRLRQGGTIGDFIMMPIAGAAGFFTGSLPWWAYAYHSGFNALLGEFLGKAVSVETGSWFSQLGNHLVNYLLLGIPAVLGFRPPWTITWLVLPLLPFVLMAWVGIIYSAIKIVFQRTPKRLAYSILFGTMAVVTAGFLVTPFGIDPSGRYFLPFAAPLALLAADRIVSLGMVKSWAGWGLMALILTYQLGGNLQSALANPPGLTTQFDQTTVIDHRYDSQLVRFLLAQGETAGYTNYWTAYPIAFLSQEQIILIPRLPYHLDFRYTPRDDRYSPYDEVVSRSLKAAYITTRHPALNDRLRTAFTASGVTWEEKTIGDYQVFYHLSRLIRPEELNLGINSPNP